MPKIKTKKSLAKRIKITGRGKLKRRHTCQSHLNAKKSMDRKRQFSREYNLASGDAKKLKKLLPYLK